jgi:predicted nucleotidyltransferase
MADSTPVPVEVARVVRELERRLRERFGSELRDVRLFGSYARGTANEDSDVDVFVLLDCLDYFRQRDVLNIAGELFAETDLLVSPTVFGVDSYRVHLEQGRPLVSEIERQGLSL